MHDIFKGFLRLRLLAFIPLLLVIVVLLGVSALSRGSAVLGIAILAAVPVVVVVVLGRLMARRARDRASDDGGTRENASVPAPRG